MGIFDFLKNTAQKVLSGIGSVGEKILKIPNTIREGISKGYDFVKDIPVIGDLATQFANTPLIRGMSPAQIASMASRGLDLANKGVEAAQDIGRGDLKQGLTKGGEIYRRFRPMAAGRSPGII